MDDRTKEALEGSIKKWEGIVDGTIIDRGQDNCPLCQLFFENSCRGCPVSIRSGKRFCRNTPYDDYDVTESQDAAEAELDFLISLRDPTEVGS